VPDAAGLYVLLFAILFHVVTLEVELNILSKEVNTVYMGGLFHVFHLLMDALIAFCITSKIFRVEYQAQAIYKKIAKR
jgi:hypothetical protein